MKTITNSIINKIYKLFLLSVLLFSFLGEAQTTVNSLQALKPYLNDNNVNVKLAPGTYTVTKSDVDNGLYTSFTIIDGSESKVLFLFEGSNSTYDFTGVKINVETDVFSAFGSYGIFEIQIIGNNNVLKNLTIVDVGSVNDNPTFRATNIAMDGSQNRIEGFNVTVKGSYPYGYGDIFGKGGTIVIRHRKHSGIVVRGESNHLLNTTLIHKSYGHGIFMQASNNALIEGCYVEGELRTTDDVLAEAGTGSPADDVDFMTVWGYKLKPGWTFSLQEDGIRDYNGGETVINGVDYSRGASNTTIIDCTVKYMRSGVTIGLGAGTQSVENVTTLGCESGFWVRDNADVINCRGDASVGPLYSEDRERRNVTIDLTLLDNDVQKIGNTPSLYLAGSGHNITLKDGTTSFDSDIEILVGGTRLGHRWLAGSGEEPPYYTAADLTFVNETLYPIVLGSNSSDNNIISCGPVTNNGSNNNIQTPTTCGPNVCVENPAFIEAECYSNQSGVQSEQCSEGGLNIGWINNNDWMAYNDLDLTNAKSMNTRVACNTAGGTIELRLGSATGTLIGSQVVSNTGGNQVWETLSTTIESVTGTQDVYLVFKGGNGYLFNINYFGFSDTILSINENETKEINTFPNPVINTLYINNGEALNFELYNSLGQLQYKSKVVSNEYKLDMSAFSSGLYFLKTFNGKTVSIQKIVKQ